MVEMGEISFATRMREVVRRIVTEEINRQRPGIQYGIVQSYNRATRKATVLLAGDVTAITVGMGAIQPSANGQRVRVEGPRGDKYITDVVGAAPFVDTTPAGIAGGSYASGGANGDKGTTTISNLNADLRSGWYEAQGGATGLPPAASGEWWLIQVLRHTNPANNHTRQIAYQMTGTGADEMVAYTRSARSSGTAFAAGEFTAWRRIDTRADTTLHSLRDTHLAMNAPTQVPTRWNGSHLDWSGRVITLGAGRGSFGPSEGYWSFTRPTTGASVPGYGGVAARTVTADGIPITDHEALYGIPTVGSTNSAVSLAVVGYTSDFVVPDHWVLLAHRSESGGPIWTAWAGTIDQWRLLTPHLISGTTAYETSLGNNYAPRYTKRNGIVFLDGLLNVSSTNPTHAFTLPVGYRPYAGAHMVAAFTTSQYVRRLDIHGDGTGVFRESPSLATGWHAITTCFPAHN